MAYNKEELYTKALQVIEREGTLFISDLAVELGIDRTTFYRLFPKDCNKYNSLKAAIASNKVQAKKQLRQNWLSEDAPATLQIALYKLLANDDELARLSNRPLADEQEKEPIYIENFQPLISL